MHAYDAWAVILRIRGGAIIASEATQLLKLRLRLIASIRQRLDKRTLVFGHPDYTQQF